MSGKIYVITNRKLIKHGNLESVVKSAVKGGADAVILREKDLGVKELTELALRLMDAIDGKAPLIINGNPEVAEKVSASGLHLSYNNFMNSTNEFHGLRGVSIHSLEEAIKVQNKAADYVIAGHIFDTSCKAGLPGRGLEYLNNICRNITLPVIAIGGITEENIKSVIEQGAAGAAVMSSVMEAKDPERVINNLRGRFTRFS